MAARTTEGGFTVLATDLPAADADIETALLDAIGARLVIAPTGEEDELLALAADADAILTCFKNVTPAVIRAATRLRVIGRYGRRRRQHRGRRGDASSGSRSPTCPRTASTRSPSTRSR